MDAPIIHIVDDDEATRKATSRLLAAAGYAVHSYASGDEFLAATPSHAPGCVILDMRMPGRSGLELQTALAQREDPLPIIFVTGHGEVHDSVQAIQRGAIDFLIKPTEPEALLDAVARALARDQADRATRIHQRDVQKRYARLTEREREVFVHLSRWRQTSASPSGRSSYTARGSSKNWKWIRWPRSYGSPSISASLPQN